MTMSRSRSVNYGIIFIFVYLTGRYIKYLQILFLVQRISPEASSKVQLQIVFHNDSSYNFQFANKNGRQVQVKDRDEIKERLAELIPQHRQKANKDLEEKNKFVFIVTTVNIFYFDVLQCIYLLYAHAFFSIPHFIIFD